MIHGYLSFQNRLFFYKIPSPFDLRRKKIKQAVKNYTPKQGEYFAL